MSDLVERLREGRDRLVERVMHRKGGALMSIPANPERDLDIILDEAADEIERLREALEKIKLNVPWNAYIGTRQKIENLEAGWALAREIACAALTPAEETGHE